MKWKAWKRGLVVACLTGLFTALTGLVAGITWKQFWSILAVCIGKDALLWMKEHPVSSIKDTEVIFKKDVS